MGKKRVSVKTLSDGTKVTHHPPDDQHPEGRMVLIPEDKIAQRLLDKRKSIHDGISDIHVAHYAKVQVKRDAEAAYPAVPPEKRFI